MKSSAQEKHKVLEEELERLKREIDETYRGVAELTNELATGVKDRDISELRKEVGSLSQELEETYQAVTELANELYEANSALQKSEAQLGLALEEANLGLWEWNLETGGLTVSAQWYRILAYAPSEVKSHITAWEKLIHPYDLPVWHSTLNAYLQGKQSLFHTEHRLLSKSGRWIWVMVSGQGKKRQDGNLLYLAGIMMDIDDRKRAEKEVRQLNEELELRVTQRTTELEQSNQKLKAEIKNHKQTEAKLRAAQVAAEAANQAKSMFLANMSHELRTPLNGIIGFSNLMRRESLSNRHKLSSEQKECLDIISRSGEHLLSLINSVLDLSKIEAGLVTINATNFDLYSLLDELDGMFALKANDKGLRLILEYTNIPQYVKADSLKLRQVLINLLNNALKFTEAGEIVLRVRLLETEKVQLHFEVEDTGSGIAADELDTLFEAFSQANTGRNTQEGTGLGLTISREFVDLMGGSLDVRSEVNRGTIFFFNIDVEVAEEADVKEEVASKQVIGLKPNQERYQILLVDDNETNRQLLVKLLQPLGFGVKEARNGQEAVDIWRQWQPHLIWMDIRMPVMDGYQATRIIKAEPRGETVKILALTASTYEEKTALAAGCEEYFRKPLQENEIFEAMHNHIGVEYIYGQAQELATKIDPKEILNPETLRIVPAELLTKLSDLAVLANITEVNKAIEEVSFYDEGIARALTELANGFEYSKIVEFARAATNS